MLTLVLADAELELVPPALAGHPSVRTPAKKRGRSPATILLDSSLHHPALRNFPEGERRGRPDIAHLFVLLCLDSVLNARGSSARWSTPGTTTSCASRRRRASRRTTRASSASSRTCSRRARSRRTSPSSPWSGACRWRSSSASFRRPLGPSRRAERVNLWTEFAKLEGDLVAVVRGFPHGDFRSSVKGLCDRIVSIHEEPLRAWTVTSEILVAYRQHAGGTASGAGSPRFATLYLTAS